MPKYDYRCRQCGETFEIMTGMNDSRDDVQCSQCRSADVFRLYGGIGTRTSSGGGLPSMAGMPTGGGHGGGCCGGHCH